MNDRLKLSRKFIPELWSNELIKEYKATFEWPQRSYGERLLRAAAKGEDWTKIKRVEEHPHDHYASHAADALAYSIDNSIIKSLLNGE